MPLTTAEPSIDKGEPDDRGDHAGRDLALLADGAGHLERGVRVARRGGLDELGDVVRHMAAAGEENRYDQNAACASAIDPVDRLGERGARELQISQRDLSAREFL